MNSASLHKPTLRALAPFVDRNETRYYLHGVNVDVDPDGATYTATNGHVLATRRVELGAGVERNALTGAWILPLDAVKALKVKKGQQHEVTMTESAGEIRLQDESAAVVTKAIDGSFPDWRKLVPVSVTGVLKDGVDGHHLAKVEELGAALDIGLPIAHWNSNGPACFTFAGCASTLVIVMPRRNPAVSRWAVPAFVTKGGANV